MDLQLPDIDCKDVKMMPSCETIIKNVEQWFSQYDKTKWTDKHETIKSILYCFPKSKDIDKLTLIAKAIVWLIRLDDYLDNNPDQMQHWLKVIESQKAITTDSMEIMFEIIINELMEKPFAYSQKIRLMDGLTMFVESYKTSSKIRDGSLRPTMDEYFGCRYADGFMHFTYVLVEFDLGINLSDKWHIDFFRDLHTKISDHAQVVNDIYSFKREMEGNDYPKYSYMSIVRQDSNLTFEDAIHVAVKSIESIEIEISDLITKVKSLADEIPDEYINGIMDLKDGILYFCKISKRNGKYNAK